MVSILSKSTYRSNAMPIKISVTLFIELKQIILKLVWNQRRPWNRQSNLEKAQAGGIILPDFKLHHKATMIKTVWYWDKNKPADQWNRTECPDINPRIHGQLKYDKGAMRIYLGKGSLFNSLVLGKLDCHVQENKNGSPSYTTQNRKWTTDINVRPEAIKLLKKTDAVHSWTSALATYFCICFSKQREQKQK